MPSGSKTTEVRFCSPRGEEDGEWAGRHRGKVRRGAARGRAALRRRCHQVGKPLVSSAKGRRDHQGASVPSEEPPRRGLPLLLRGVCRRRRLTGAPVRPPAFRSAPARPPAFRRAGKPRPRGAPSVRGPDSQHTPGPRDTQGAACRPTGQRRATDHSCHHLDGLIVLDCPVVVCRGGAPKRQECGLAGVGCAGESRDAPIARSPTWRA